MNWYKNSKDEWKEIIETVAREMNKTEQMVEKDTIQSLFLFKLSKADLPYVFKGGTSLSKAYSLIDRFSEDIDLSTNCNITDSEKRHTKKLILEIADSLGLALTNLDNVMSRHDYNKYIFLYESLFSDHPLETIVETSFYQPAYPVEKHTIGNIIGDFCKEKGIALPIIFEASTFEMNVQTIERTFVDKVFAICDYRIQNMEERDSRHLYDLAKLVPKVKVTPELKDLILKVRKDRSLSKNNPSAKPEYNITILLKEIIQSRFYERDYKDITQKLLYENISYDEAIQNGLVKVVEMNIF